MQKNIKLAHKHNAHTLIILCISTSIFRAINQPSTIDIIETQSLVIVLII